MITNLELKQEIEKLGSGESFNISISNGDSWEVGYADCWIGGKGLEGWMCDALGNVVYESANELSEGIMEFLEDDFIIEIDY